VSPLGAALLAQSLGRPFGLLRPAIYANTAAGDRSRPATPHLDTGILGVISGMVMRYIDPNPPTVTHLFGRSAHPSRADRAGVFPTSPGAPIRRPGTRCWYMLLTPPPVAPCPTPYRRHRRRRDPEAAEIGDEVSLVNPRHTSGNNGAYRAGPGWDACTELGVPVGQALLTTL